jgi:hypothetical protein
MNKNKHEIYNRRGNKNLWLGLIMGSFVVLVFFVTIVKLSNGDSMQAFDHSLRPEMVDKGNGI